MGRFGRRAASWFIAWGLAAGASLAAQPSIRFAEPVSLALKAGQAEFDAYGRRFSLQLEGNDRLLGNLPAQHKAASTSYRLLRGSVAGAAGSWVRLTETAQGIEGAIWDGQELYAVTRYENIATLLTTPLTAAADQTVVYRLSDARDAFPMDFCGAQESEAKTGLTALDQYKSLMGELQTRTQAGAVVGSSITRQVDIALLADSAFQQAEGSDPTAAMLARLNIVEGIFSEQMGLLILAGELRLVPAGSDPFTTTKPTTLLEQLSKYRMANPAVRSRGLAHLMTGKDLDGTTAGIAYVGTVCEKERAVSLSQRNYGTTLSALIMAHELGHNFGASHDAQPGTPCASTQPGYIMASSVTGFGTFSQCSMDSMKPVIASAGCITAAEFADVSLEAGSGHAWGEGGVPMTLPFKLRSLGNVDASNTEFTLTLPGSSALSVTAAGASQGSCAISGAIARCALGVLRAGATADVSITVLSTAGATFTAQARATSTNDRLISNNDDLVQVNVRSGIDARLAMSASSANVDAGTTFDVYADVSSLRAMAVRNAQVSLAVNQSVTGATVPGGVCSVDDGSVHCSIAEIPSGTTRRVTLQLMAGTPGVLSASGTVSADGEGDLSNNDASASAWVQASRDIEVSASAAVIDLPVGMMHEVPFTLRARGSQALGNVELLVTTPAGVAVDSIDAGAAACTHPSDYVWRCALGAFAPGESRVVKLRFLASAPTSADLSAVALAADDEYPANNAAAVRLRIEHRLDLGIALASGGSGVEDMVFEGRVALVSNGRESVTGGALDIEINDGGRLTGAALLHGEGCTLLNEQRARCALPSLPAGRLTYVDYSAEFAEPGDYDVTFTITAPGDSASANDTLTRAIVIRPYLDVSLTGSLDMSGLFGEQTRVQSFTLRTGRRGLATARLLAAHTPPALRVAAISAGMGECRVDAEGGSCDFRDLPADANVAVAITYHALEGSAVVEPVVSVATPGDVAPHNDRVSARVETLAGTDLDLRVAGNLGGPRAATLNFPVIEVVNGQHRAMTPHLEVTLPEGVTVEDVSASEGICSGTGTLRCDFEMLEPFARASVSFSVRASRDGNFVSEVKVTALNDVNSANDARQVSMAIGGASAQASDGPGAGGKGGGGRMEWLAIAFLGFMLMRKNATPSARRGR